jgi:hypothetical protein
MTEGIVACGQLLGNDHEMNNYAKAVRRQRPVNSNTSHLLYINFNNISLSTSRTSRGSVLNTATSYRLDATMAGVRIPVDSRMFTFPYRPDRLWSPSNLLSSGCCWFFPGVKWSVGEADLSLATSAEVKKSLIYTSIPRYVFMA